MKKSAKNENGGTPDFSSLMQIMVRFENVPYSQFQQELDDWFTEGMNTQDNVNVELLHSLRKLASSIYHEAEVLQILQDANVISSHG